MTTKTSWNQTENITFFLKSFCQCSGPLTQQKWKGFFTDYTPRHQRCSDTKWCKTSSHVTIGNRMTSQFSSRGGRIHPSGANFKRPVSSELHNTMATGKLWHLSEVAPLWYVVVMFEVGVILVKGSQYWIAFSIIFVYLCQHVMGCYPVLHSFRIQIECFGNH